MRLPLPRFSAHRAGSVVLMLAGCLSACGGSAYRVPSGSMEPTLKVDQRVAVNTAAFRGHPPKLDDIILFYAPSAALQAAPVCGSSSEGLGHAQPCGVTGPGGESREKFIKRVVGLPGDHIAIVDGHVIRNGTRESDPYITPCGSGGVGCNFPRPVTISAGRYFVVGDNRGLSEDSREWGPIPRAWIVGLVRP